MGIIHTAKKNMKDEITRKKKLEIIEEKKRSNQNPTITTREELDVCYSLLKNFNKTFK